MLRQAIHTCALLAGGRLLLHMAVQSEAAAAAASAAAEQRAASKAAPSRVVSGTVTHASPLAADVKLESGERARLHITEWRDTLISPDQEQPGGLLCLVFFALHRPAPMARRQLRDTSCSCTQMSKASVMLPHAYGLISPASACELLSSPPIVLSIPCNTAGVRMTCCCLHAHISHLKSPTVLRNGTIYSRWLVRGGVPGARRGGGCGHGPRGDARGSAPRHAGAVGAAVSHRRRQHHRRADPPCGGVGQPARRPGRAGVSTSSAWM